MWLAIVYHGDDHHVLATSLPDQRKTSFLKDHFAVELEYQVVAGRKEHAHTLLLFCVLSPTTEVYIIFHFCQFL